MRWITFLLCWMPGLLLAAETAPLDEARVAVPYGELRRLIERADGKPAEPPLGFAIHSARYELEWGSDMPAGRATFEVEAFKDVAQLVPLFGSDLIVDEIAPSEACVVVDGKFYALMVAGRKKQKVTLRFHVRPETVDAGSRVAWPVSPAVVSSLAMTGVPKGYRATVADALPIGDRDKGDQWQLGRSPALRVDILRPSAPAAPELKLPAIVSEASSEMRVVRDGALYNKMTWKVRHGAALAWSLEMPAGAQFVSCLVGGRPALPLKVDERKIEIRLPDPGARGESTVEFSYTAKKDPLAPVRGELALELPSTPLLVEASDWKVTIPAGLETIAMQGNVEFEPNPKAGEIHLRKQLVQGDAPAAHIFYQKTETNK